MSKELALRPSCSACGAFLELRDPTGGRTPEQRFCGVWYDHPARNGCQAMSTVLFVSDALRAQLAVPA